jgi:hypothetical protein
MMATSSDIAKYKVAFVLWYVMCQQVPRLSAS